MAPKKVELKSKPSSTEEKVNVKNKSDKKDEEIKKEDSESDQEVEKDEEKLRSKKTISENLKKDPSKEKEVIEFMRKNSLPSSFRMWRKRMNSRKTKHSFLREKSVNRFKCSRQRNSGNKIAKR